MNVTLRAGTPGDADAFIAFGVGNWPNRMAELLCEISFTPLCSPTLLNKVGGFSRPADVLRANLLHLDDTEDWARVDKPDRVRELGVDPDRPSVIFVGRITRQKGVVHLLRAAAQFDKDVQLVLCAGAGE